MTTIRRNNNTQKGSIGQNLRKQRNEKHLTQEMMVAKLQLRGIKISRAIYSQIEADIHDINVDVLIACTEIFDCDYNVLFSGLKLSELEHKPN